MSSDISVSSATASEGVRVGPAIPPARIAIVPIGKVAWLVTTVLCAIAALLLLLSGYVGYFGVLLAVGLAAAVNLR
jgi:hypothetical protein